MTTINIPLSNSKKSIRVAGRLKPEIYNLTMVSFESDFDRTPRARETPPEIL
jgi:hypothetical protein